MASLAIIIPLQNVVLVGYTVFSMSVIPSTFKAFITLIAVVRFCSNLHHILTITQCMFDRKTGAERSVLRELCHFVILTVRCL